VPFLKTGTPCPESIGDNGPIDDAGDPSEESFEVRRIIELGDMDILEVLGGLSDGKPIEGGAVSGAEAGPGAGAAMGMSVEVDELFDVRIVGFKGSEGAAFAVAGRVVLRGTTNSLGERTGE